MAIFAKHFPDYEYCETPKDKPADIDAIPILRPVIRERVDVDGGVGRNDRDFGIRAR